MTGIPYLTPATLAAVAVVAACAACDRRPGNPAQTASTYTSDADTDAAKHGREGTVSGKQLETPPKLPGIRVQIENLRRNPNPSDGDLAGYKFALADLVSSMQADLQRLGIGEVGIRSAGDSLLNDLGGGTGPAQGLSSKEVPAHTAAVERLIQRYQQLTNGRTP